jgi:hypothetical protein
MKHFKVRVQYTNGIEFIHECKTLTNWQAAPQYADLEDDLPF